MAILNKMSGIRPDDRLCEQIAAAITEGNREQLKAKLKVLGARDELPAKAQQALAAQLYHPDMGEDIYHALKQLEHTGKSVQQKLSAYEKKNE